MATLSFTTLHASTVAIGGRAVMIEGPSGSGKSDLALRLIDRGATLVSDDYTLVARQGETLTARPPHTIAGKMEVRGLGIVELPHVDDVPVEMIVQLNAEVPRLPERRTRQVAGVEIRELALDPFTASAPIKVEFALKEPTT